MAEPQPERGFEDYPLSRKEYISAMVHFYRGELTRANTWRIRLDTTTNWAIVAAMGFLSFAFGTKDHSHASIVLGMLLEIHFLTLEARRFRFFDVWRNRLRMIEENFYGPLLTRDLHSPAGNWGDLIASDLLRPRFKISYLQAFRARFLRNYAPLFVILLVAWLVKLQLHPSDTNGGWTDRMAIGPIEWYWAFSVVGSIYLVLLCITIFVKKVRAPELEYWSQENPHRTTLDF